MEPHDPRAWRLETDLVLVETYRPGSRHSPFPDGMGSLADHEDGVRLVGAIVVPEDEVVLYLFAARSPAQVARLVESAGLKALRVVPASWAAPLTEAQPLVPLPVPVSPRSRPLRRAGSCRRARP